MPARGLCARNSRHRRRASSEASCPSPAAVSSWGLFGLSMPARRPRIREAYDSISRFSPMPVRRLHFREREDGAPTPESLHAHSGALFPRPMSGCGFPVSDPQCPLGGFVSEIPSHGGSSYAVVLSPSRPNGRDACSEE